MSHTSLTNSRRNSDKPHVSIDIEKYGDGHRSPGEHRKEERRVSVGSPDIDVSKTKDGNPYHVPFLGFDLQKYSATVQFCILSCGIFFFYLLYGITMEQIFRIPGMRTVRYKYFYLLNLLIF